MGNVHSHGEVSEDAVERPVVFNSFDYREMIAKSLLSTGNNKRLKAAMEKAQRGEDVTIAFIGGSITQGAGAQPIQTECYAYKSYLHFKNMFGKNGGENVHFVKAGVGGTPSELGMIRFERDILRDGTVEPDVVVVEFAVNDADDETNGACYESLCLKILSHANRPAVILLFSVFENDWNLQDRLSSVGKHYDLPMVSVKDAVVDQFRLKKVEGNIISKKQYFYDIYHPTNSGHTVMADCLGYLFWVTGKSLTSELDISLDKPPVIGNYFADVHLMDRKVNGNVARIEKGGFSEIDNDLQMVEIDEQPDASPQFPFNWMHTPLSGNASFKMAIKCSGLILVYKDSGNKEFGKADIFVDGLHIKTVDPLEINWNHCHAAILFQEEECVEHEIEIKMAVGYEDKYFTILGFGYKL
jgi:hypothetical protein